jgi:hypothetical protein
MSPNDGKRELEYSLGNEEDNRRLSKLINEFCHVFHCHADGNWQSVYKPKYTAMLCDEISRRPSLIRKLLAIDDPVVNNVTHAAILLAKEHDGIG